MDKKVDKAVDIAKFIMSIFIVGIHSHIEYVIPDGIGRFYVLSVFLRSAVPFFFVVSGYYLGKKIWNQSLVESKKSVLKYIQKLVVPFLFWSTISLLIYLPTIHETCESNLEFVAKIIRQAIFYPVGAMWFVLACMVGAYIIHIFWNHKRLAVIFAIVLYGVALLGNNYFFLLSNTKYMDLMLKVIISTRNGLFVGFPFMLIGALLAKPKMIDGWKYKYVISVLIIAFILLSIETYVVYGRPYNDDRSLFVLWLLFIPCLVVVLLKTKVSMRIRTTGFRKFSTVLYFSHRFFMSIISMIVSDIHFGILFFVPILCSWGLYMGIMKTRVKKLFF